MIYSADLRDALSWAIADIHTNGWAPGTGGNFSAVYQREPELLLLMAPSGVDKGMVEPDDLIVVNRLGKVLQGNGFASAETALHLAIAEEAKAGAVLHTHSVFNTLLSQHFAKTGYVEVSGYEMLKGLEGISTHEATVRIPILPNSQDMEKISVQVTALLQAQPGLYGVLLQGHGLYTWGTTLFHARRHLEILEFFFELIYRQLMIA
jgi:methylthioribulose-1-phosphate dehydratase